MTSTAELTLAAQLEQAGIPFEREYRFAPPRRWRADFRITHSIPTDILVEIDGGAFIAGRHSRGTGVEADCEKTSAAAILGYRVIRATPRQVEDGRCLDWIQQALGLSKDAAA
jgi:very-short-patch-repair endonuclease